MKLLNKLLDKLVLATPEEKLRTRRRWSKPQIYEYVELKRYN